MEWDHTPYYTPFYKGNDMKLNIGDGVSYRAELFRIKSKHYTRLDKEGHGYILRIINDELVYVWNGVRVVLVRRNDITKNHNS